MLILSRRPGESLTIGDDVVVTVVGVPATRSGWGLPRRGKSGCCGRRSIRPSKKTAAANGLDSNRRPGDAVRQLRGRNTEKVP